MNASLRLILWILLSVAVASAQQSGDQSKPDKNQVPVMDGGAGPCSLDLTVLGSDGKPVYAATVKVHIAYGFGGFRKLDLQAGTNEAGKVRFTGLPDRVKRPPLEFHASKDGLEGIATDDPTTECQARHEVRLEKPSAAQTQ
ncbi:MAG TPA: hypothetical protein VF133_12930 [Terriglobales bacterium]